MNIKLISLIATVCTLLSVFAVTAAAEDGITAAQRKAARNNGGK